MNDGYGMAMGKENEREALKELSKDEKSKIWGIFLECEKRFCGAENLDKYIARYCMCRVYSLMKTSILAGTRDKWLNMYDKRYGRGTITSQVLWDYYDSYTKKYRPYIFKKNNKEVEQGIESYASVGEFYFVYYIKYFTSYYDVSEHYLNKIGELDEMSELSYLVWLMYRYNPLIRPDCDSNHPFILYADMMKQAEERYNAKFFVNGYLYDILKSSELSSNYGKVI